MPRVSQPAANAMTRADQVSLVNAVTRRGFLGTAVGMLAAMRINPSLAQSTGGATPVPGMWPRSIDGSLGEVTIPAKPTRVVAVSDWYEVDYLVAQGVEPILYGYTNRFGQGISPWLIEAGGEKLPQYDLSSTGEPNLEAIVVADPDLIVADPFVAEQVVAQLNVIAPTVGIPTPYSGSRDWREGQILTGQATGDEEAAAAAIAETEAAIAAGREQLAPYADRTVTIAYASAYNGGSLFFATDDGQEATLIRELGMQFRGHTDNAPQSMEQLNRLVDVDILISYDSADNQEYLEANSLFQQLPVATNGRYEAVSTIASRAVFAPSTLSIRWVIPHLVETLTRAAEGNGRTVGA